MGSGLFALWALLALTACPHRVTLQHAEAGADLDAAVPVDGSGNRDIPPRSDTTLLEGAATNAEGWTWRHPQPQGNDIHAIWATKENEIWAAGDKILLLKDATGWHVVEELSFNATAIWADDETVIVVGTAGGYAVGSKGVDGWQFKLGTAGPAFSAGDLIGVWGDHDGQNAVIVATDAIGRISTAPSETAPETAPPIAPLYQESNAEPAPFLSLAGHAEGILIGGRAGNVFKVSKEGWQNPTGGTLNEEDFIRDDFIADLGSSTQVRSVWGESESRYWFVAGPEESSTANGPWTRSGDGAEPWNCVNGPSPAREASLNVIWGGLSSESSEGTDTDIWMAGGGGAIQSFQRVLDPAGCVSFYVGDEDLNALHGYPAEQDQHLWLGGNSGKIIHLQYPKQGDAANPRYAEAEIEQSADSVSKATVRALWVSPSGTVWAVGDGGLVMRRDAGSEAWEDQSRPVGVTANLHGIDGDEGVIFVVGEAGTLLHHTDSGWVNVGTDTRTDLFAVARTSTGYLAVGQQSGGTKGRAIVCSSGSCWVQSDWLPIVAAELGGGLYGIGLNESRTKGWVVGNNHAHFHFVAADGSLKLATLTDSDDGLNAETRCWRDVAYQPANNLILVGYSVSEETTCDTGSPDRGLAWHCEDLICGTVTGTGDDDFPALYGLHRASWNEMWAVGGLGKAWKIENGVANPFPTGTSNVLQTVWVNGPDDVWVAGDRGTIIQKMPAPTP